VGTSGVLSAGGSTRDTGFPDSMAGRVPRFELVRALCGGCAALVFLAKRLVRIPVLSPTPNPALKALTCLPLSAIDGRLVSCGWLWSLTSELTSPRPTICLRMRAATTPSRGGAAAATARLPTWCVLGKVSNRVSSTGLDPAGRSWTPGDLGSWSVVGWIPTRSAV
jgi:hypothetical protein